ncbi:lipase-like PAD4 [Juglans microcarpa x Juglans regia]|uniref:lipase-like PAD4 n=1 Tax=Juglans microcarpa x Juglans regia TaxID=2249226 RepID=UPI001B7DF08B|nr:lipase-like PAD4 [Juglans microcarpa x Juglans regia]
MDAEASSFETSEVLANFLASTPLLPESWRLCSIANTTAPGSFVTEQVGHVGFIAFSGIQLPASSEPSWRNLVPLESAGNGTMFSQLHRHNGGQEPVMVHAGMLQIFLSMHNSPSFKDQISAVSEKSKSIIVTGHSMGGTTASLCTLWLLSHLQSVSSPLTVLCITFGSPLLGNGSLSRAILRERWGGNFCHVVSKHDIMPRLLFAPLAPLTPLLHFLLQYWHLSMMTPPPFGEPSQLRNEDKAELFRFVLFHLGVLAQAGEETSLFWPLGSYLFCSEEGAICVDKAVSVTKMMHLMLMNSTPSSSIEDHLNYGDYVGKASVQFMNQRGFMQADLPESSYEAGVALALHSLGIEQSVAGPAKDCLKIARPRRMDRTPYLKSAELAIRLSKYAPYRAEIEWYKVFCDKSENKMGYYDCFKLWGSISNSKREPRVNLNRIKLSKFWDDVISMLDTNQLPHDFNRRAKWVNSSQSYKLLVEPLDIAEYYGKRRHLEQGHYLKHGRERRYEIFDRWWSEKERNSGEGVNTKRSKFAGLTQDSCFWARVEEAREWLENVKSESDMRKASFLWENIEAFETYARELVESKQVSVDVLAENSSYSLWMVEYRALKSKVLSPQSILHGPSSAF